MPLRNLGAINRAPVECLRLKSHAPSPNVRIAELAAPVRCGGRRQAVRIDRKSPLRSVAIRAGHGVQATGLDAGGRRSADDAIYPRSVQSVCRRYLVAQTQGIAPEIADRDPRQRIRIASGEARQLLDGGTITAQQCLIGKPDIAAEIRARCCTVSRSKAGYQLCGRLEGMMHHRQWQRLRGTGPQLSAG